MTTPLSSAAISSRYAKQIADIHKKMGINPNYAQERGLPLQAEAKKFVFVEMAPDGRDHFLAPPAAKAWVKMKKAMKKEKISVAFISGFRSVARQRNIIEQKLAKGEALESVLTRLAAPGYSEHHTGLAMDVATPDDPELEERFEKTATFKWLCENGAKFGFRMSYARDNAHKIIYEPWHWAFVG